MIPKVSHERYVNHAAGVRLNDHVSTDDSRGTHRWLCVAAEDVGTNVPRGSKVPKWPGERWPSAHPQPDIISDKAVSARTGNRWKVRQVGPLDQEANPSIGRAHRYHRG